MLWMEHKVIFVHLHGPQCSISTKKKKAENVYIFIYSIFHVNSLNS